MMFKLGRFVPPITITLKEQLLVFPEASQATAVTRFVPTGKEEPVPGVTTRLVRAQLSVAPALKVTTMGQELGLLVVMSAGQLMVGGCVSRTMTSWLQVLDKPTLSRTVQ